MSREDLHLSDQELLLWADRELPAKRAATIQRHMRDCSTCRARMAELERAIADFAQVYRHDLDASLPPVDGPRALLKARLVERRESAAAETGDWFSRARSVRAAGVLALLLLAGIALRTLPHGNLSDGSPAIPNVS